MSNTFGNNHQFLSKPLLVRSDGPMMKQRRWFKQFYTPRVTLQYDRDSNVSLLDSTENQHEQRQDSGHEPEQLINWQHRTVTSYTTQCTGIDSEYFNDHITEAVS